MMIVGHGVVERQVRGPESADGEPEQVTVVVRRYRCRTCGVVLMVGPRGLVRGRWYGAGAIGLAFSLFASGATSRGVRARVSPSREVGGSATERWVTLTRWLEAARHGELFGVVGLDGHGGRAVAERVTQVLAARGGHKRGDDWAGAVFRGAVIAS